ncbi:hypothetical protein GJAV_G00109280 [Gymnothorax javanicus]|nr:hypothetical protein GJAV_G00109280 [Gymnothorax javanicus]
MRRSWLWDTLRAKKLRGSITESLTPKVRQETEHLNGMGLQRVNLGKSRKARKQTDSPSAQQRASAQSMDLLVALQILPGFFSNCLFLALYDSVVLLKRVMSLLSFSRSAACGEWQRMLTSAGLRSIWNSFLLDAYKQVKLGGEAPNSKVVRVPSSRGGRKRSPRRKPGDECHLQLPEFRLLVEDFADVADFLLVYVDEAHPSDGWAAPAAGPWSFRVRRHRSLEERVNAARRLLEQFAIPPQCGLVADCMDNNTNAAYGVSFERVCIVRERRVAYLGGKGPFFYNLGDVRQWLEQNYGRR